MVDRIIAGDLGGGNYGIKISKPGVDVNTAALSDLIFDSQTGYSRILQKGTLLFPGGGLLTQSVTLVNTNGSPPIAACYRLWLYLGAQYATQFPIGWSATTSATQLTVTRAYDDGYDYLIGYFIFADRGV